MMVVSIVMVVDAITRSNYLETFQGKTLPHNAVILLRSKYSTYIVYISLVVL